MKRNLILDTDSYKASHWKQYPPGASAMHSYFESRGGAYGATVFFGLQYLLKEYLSKPLSMEDVMEANDFFKVHGEPFNIDAWRKIAIWTQGHGGLPIRIKAVPEGTVVPTKNVLMTVESTDPESFWLVSWLETLLVRLWYPITIATRSKSIRQTIQKYLDFTADDPLSEIDFKLHDFGSRGVSSRESAGIGGMAHLVNFKGSDTIEGVRFANHYYGAGMAGFSIPAAEHSTITSWGRDGELDAYQNMMTQFGGEGKLLACVSDSWDYLNTVSEIWCGTLLERVQKSGATVVIRPDSGDPAKIVLETLKIMDQKLGLKENSKGYKILPPYFRIIQGDGVDENSIRDILDRITLNGYSASNVTFGMGGGLLQQLNRDTLKFAYKCSEITVNGEARPVFKYPATDPGKKSKAGRMALVKNHNGILMTVGAGDAEAKDDILQVVYENGDMPNQTTLDEVRKRALDGSVRGD